MPLSLDTLLVQPAGEGSFVGTSGSASLGSGTTAGNTVLIVATTSTASGGGASIATPSGFTSDITSQASVTRLYVFRRSNVPASETSWTLTPGVSGLVKWTAFEIEGLDPVAAVDVQPSPNNTTSTTSGTTVGNGTTARSTTYDGLVVAVHAQWNSGGTTPPSFSGQSGGVTEMTDAGGDNGTASVGLAVSMATTQQLATYTSTATTSVTMTTTNAGSAYILVYTAEGAKKEPNIAFFWGFKVGVGAAGLNTGTASGLGGPYFETMAGTPAITADGMQLTGAASIQHVTLTGFSLSSFLLKAGVARLKFRFDSALPGADLELHRITPSTGGGTVVLRYVSASQKLGVKVGTGTEQLSAATVAADTWYGVDLRLIGTTTAHTCDWQVDAVDQAQATFTASTAMSGWAPLAGWSASSTGTVTFAHALYSLVAGHYPLGDHTVVRLNVDPASTPTISGTASNFGVMTANGTVAAWDATNARNAVDDWPPTVGGSADGAVATAAHATDYIEFPLETYDASGTGSVRAARVVIPMWAASATAATCRVTAHDGAASITLYPEADPNADNTSTPAWICAMWRPSGGWTQAKLDAAVVRFGSNDATPDIGPHSVGMEVVVQAGAAAPHFGALVASTRDPVTGGILKVTATPTLGYPATLHYEEGGTPTDVPAPGGTTTTEVIDAPDAPAVNYVALYPPPEDISDA